MFHEQITQTFDGKIRGVTIGHDLFLLLSKRVSCRGDTGSQFLGDTNDSVAIAMNQIARRYFQIAHLNRPADLNDMAVGVRNAETSREHLEIEALDSFDIADGPVGDNSCAVEGLENAGM